MKQKWLKRIARAMLPCFVFFVFSFSFAPKAHAATYEGNAVMGYYIHDVNNNRDSNTFTKEITLPAVNASYASGIHYSFPNTFQARFSTVPTVTFGDVAKMYVSFYFVQSSGSNGGTLTGTATDKNNWQFSYINSQNETGYLSQSLYSIDTFNSPGIGGIGFSVEGKFQGSEAFPIRVLGFRQLNNLGVVANSGNINAGIYITSARIITTVYTGEMEALDNVANQIIAQNDILLAMKGDIVAILQDIYAMTGDMYAAQNLLNAYISQMLPLLEDIDQTTTNIYSLLSSQLRLLETAINNAAGTIEAAISAQTAAMIAYLEQYFNTGNEVPDDTYQQQQDAENILDQMESLEKPNVDTIVPEIGDYSDSGVSGVLSAIFSSNLIVTMMTLSASFAFGAYVLFGKRE